MALLTRAKKMVFSYVYRHPILTLEHVGVATLLLLWHMDSTWPNHERCLKSGQMTSASGWATVEAGPLNAFTSVGIIEAPLPSMEITGLEEFGKVVKRSLAPLHPPRNSRQKKCVPHVFDHSFLSCPCSFSIMWTSVEKSIGNYIAFDACGS